MIFFILVHLLKGIDYLRYIAFYMCCTIQKYLHLIIDTVEHLKSAAAAAAGYIPNFAK